MHHRSEDKRIRTQIDWLTDSGVPHPQHSLLHIKVDTYRERERDLSKCYFNSEISTRWMWENNMGHSQSLKIMIDDQVGSVLKTKKFFVVAFSLFYCLFYCFIFIPDKRKRKRKRESVCVCVCVCVSISISLFHSFLFFFFFRLKHLDCCKLITSLVFVVLCICTFVCNEIIAHRD